MTNKFETAFKLIAKFEGCRLSPYPCPAKVWTIGYGNTTLPDGTPVRADTPPCTQSEADAMLLQTIQQIDEALTSLVERPLTPGQRAALTSLIFNIGETAFRRSTLLQFLNKGEDTQAADQFLLWVHVGGKALRGLTLRREEERKLFLADTER